MLSTNAEKPTPAAASAEYHKIAFLYLEQTLAPQLEEALLLKPRSIRSQTILRALPTDQVLDGPSIWPVVKNTLDVIEQHMKEVLQRRSVAFWLHLYRRIGAFLHPQHEDRMDDRTVALVRQVVEAAICKCARADSAVEFALTSHINIKKVLGGLLLQAIKETQQRAFVASKSFERLLKSAPQWVLRDFTSDDFIGIYFIEGLAYQYWRTVALLRSLGKGAAVEFSADGDWNYHTTPEFDSLIVSVDKRTDDLPGAVRHWVGIRCDAFSGNMKVSLQAARSIG
jgi:hypothetical protein